MNKNGDIVNPAWELLLTGREEDLYKGFTLCYDDLYRLGLYLYKDVELVKESIQLLFLELWKMKTRSVEVKNCKEYVLTIFKRILYKQRTGVVKHWSRLEIFDQDVFVNEHYTEAYEEILILHQQEEGVRARLMRLLPLLSERQKELIRMRYFEEKNIDEIVELTSLTARTIYNTLHNALGKLRELLAENKF
jgi:RNA polymerase sigma factor (sigma-70 family)